MRTEVVAALISRRLSNQQLTACTFHDPGALVAWLGAVQAQDYPAAKWGVGLRAGLTDADIEHAFNAGTILRTHVMRPTWHFVTPNDIRWLLALTGPRISALMASYQRKLDLDARTFARSRRVIERALEKDKHLTRAELALSLTRARIPARGLRLGHLVMQAELDQVICSGPRRGKQFTYALLADRAPRARVLPRDEALAELTLRYFSSHGPATLRDYAWWSGLTLGDARRGVDLARSAMAQETHDNRTYWRAAAPLVTRRSMRGAHLLPNFDEYLVAYRDRHLVIDSTAAKSSALYRHHLVVDGRLAGSWSGKEHNNVLTVTIAPARRLSRADVREIRASAQRLGAFLNKRVAVTFAR